MRKMRLHSKNIFTYCFALYAVLLRFQKKNRVSSGY